MQNLLTVSRVTTKSTASKQWRITYETERNSYNAKAYFTDQNH